MTEFDAKAHETPDLLRYYADILDELKHRDVVRTSNNPVGDYAELLVAQKLGFSLERNSKSGYDATDPTNKRIQIKSRRLSSASGNRRLSVIRNLDSKEFDYLVGVLFNRDFTVKEAYKIPHDTISDYARFSEHQNGHILSLRGGILSDPRVNEITRILSDAV